MGPRPSGGGTALDPVVLTFTDSDSNSDSSDAPQFIPSPVKTEPPPPTVTAPDTQAPLPVEVGNADSDPLAGEASSSLSPMPSLSNVKRIRSLSPDRAPLQPVKRAKNTARKSTQHISTTQRLRWEAARRQDVIEKEKEDEDDMNHEEAMQQAGAARRRSESARRASLSPKKGESNEPLPVEPHVIGIELAGSKDGTPELVSPTVTIPTMKNGVPGSAIFAAHVNPENAAVGRREPSPQSQPQTSDYASAPTLPTAPQPVAGPSRLGSVRRDSPAPQASSSRATVRPSPFQVSDAPGSWGHAVPMMSQRAMPRSRQSSMPNAEAHVGTAPIDKVKKKAEGSVSQHASPPSDIVIASAETTETAASDGPALSVAPLASSSQVRRFPKWATSATPSPPPMSAPVGPPAGPPTDLDELESDFQMSLGDIQQPIRPGQDNVSSINQITTTATAGPIDLVDLGTLPSISNNPSPKPIFEKAPSPEPMLIDAMGTSPLIPEEPMPGRAECAPAISLLAPDPASRPRQSLEIEVVASDLVDMADQLRRSLPPLRYEDSVSSIHSTPEDIEMESTNSIVPQIGDSRSGPTASSMIAEILDVGSGPVEKQNVDADPADLGLHHHDVPIEEAVESLGESVQEVDLSRSRESSASSGIEEIPAIIAMTQSVFARNAVLPSSARAKRMQAVADSANDPTPAAGPSRPTRTKKEPLGSRASSNPDSPSKRLSSRLASRTLTPVYIFSTRYDRSPVQWRQTVEMDGESDVDGLLASTPTSTVSSTSGPSSTIIDGEQRTISRTYTLPPIVEAPPPPERRAKAKRSFDTRLIDEWNKMSPTMTRNPALHRLIFESYVDECVEGAEPEIKVHNTVDMESIPPYFEFQYSNEMLYHNDVPEPELGKGCDCEGGCSDKSKTCSCLARQEAYNFGVNKHFAYDKSGHLKQAVPIWECGPNCGCPPECMNRVIQRGRGSKALVDLFKTKLKGWGVRARERIAPGTFLGIYAGEVITEAESERRGNIYAEVGRTYLFDCDGWQIANPPAGLKVVDPRLAELAYASAQRAKAAVGEEDASSVYNAYSIDAFHYGFTRFFNHSCDPNLQIVQAYVNDFHPERPLLVIFTRREVMPNEELCISYKGVPDEEEEEVVVTQRSKRNGKAKKVTRKKNQKSAVAHVGAKDAALKDRCFCGAWNCDGVMFKIAAAE